MKAFICIPVTVNHDRRWALRQAEDGGAWTEVPNYPLFYATEDECEVARRRLDEAENV
jgi:hypothetical protein